MKSLFLTKQRRGRSPASFDSLERRTFFDASAAGSVFAGGEPMDNGAIIVDVGVPDAMGNGSTAGDGLIESRDVPWRVPVRANAPPVVRSIVVDDASTQRSMVRSLTVQFDRPGVTWDPEAFRLVRRQDGLEVGVTATSVQTQGRTDAVLRFSGPDVIGGSLPDGSWVLTVVADKVRDAAGRTLARDVTARFHRLFGDSDGDRWVSGLDLVRFWRAHRRQGTDPQSLNAFDYDGNGRLDAADLLQLRRRIRARVI